MRIIRNLCIRSLLRQCDWKRLSTERVTTDTIRFEHEKFALNSFRTLKIFELVIPGDFR